MTYIDSHIGETARRLSQSAVDHAGTDSKLHIVRHCLNSDHATVNIENFKILKVVSATFLLVCFVCLKERTWETRKNVFYLSSKALFVLEITKF